MARVRRSPDHADAAAIEASVQAWNRHMAVLEAALQRTSASVCGDCFTLADVVLGLATHRWMATPMERPELPPWRASMVRCASVPPSRSMAATACPEAPMPHGRSDRNLAMARAPANAPARCGQRPERACAPLCGRLRLQVQRHRSDRRILTGRRRRTRLSNTLARRRAGPLPGHAPANQAASARRRLRGTAAAGESAASCGDADPRPTAPSCWPMGGRCRSRCWRASPRCGSFRTRRRRARRAPAPGGRPAAAGSA